MAKEKRERGIKYIFIVFLLLVRECHAEFGTQFRRRLLDDVGIVQRRGGASSPDNIELHDVDIVQSEEEGGAARRRHRTTVQVEVSEVSDRLNLAAAADDIATD
jgi:hypothetical protein